MFSDADKYTKVVVLFEKVQYGGSKQTMLPYKQNLKTGGITEVGQVIIPTVSFT